MQIGIYHFWVGNRTGYIFSSDKMKPTKGGERLKYMGFSSDIGWPKLMSTGRLLHKPNAKSKKKQKKKLSQSRKTGIALNQQRWNA